MNRFDDANDDFATTFEYLLDIASNSYKVFKSSGITKKTKIIKLVFSNLQIKDGKLGYTYKKPFNNLVKMGNCKNWLPRTGSNRRPSD